MASRRREITELIILNLKEIDGLTSGFDAAYTYNINLFNNVDRGLKFLDEINDFPFVFVQAGEEIRNYQTEGNTSATLDIVIRCWIHAENAVSVSENLIQDIEHVIYSIPSNTNLEILDIIINNISTDEGILEPWGLAEIFVTVFYEIES